METDATRMCALLVGLPDVVVVGVGDWPSWLRIVVTIDGERPTCECGGAVHRHGVREVVLVDLPVFGRPSSTGVAQATLAMHRMRSLLVRRAPRDRDGRAAR